MKLVNAEKRWTLAGMLRHKEAGKMWTDASEVYVGEWEMAVLVSGLFGKEGTLFGGGVQGRERGGKGKGKGRDGVERFT
jgi:hypothetical protein